MPPLLRLLRPHQWAKNLLVFTSLFLGHRYTELPLLLDTFWCFAAFCLAASAGYIVNDVLDLSDDRAHPDKCRRPLAAGEVGIAPALVLALLLAIAAVWLALGINTWVLAVLVVYMVSVQLYSLWLKRRLLLDVVVLAVLYTLRIIAGVAVMQVEPSFWLLSFAMFLFFSLAILKRFIELRGRNADSRRASLRAWRDEDAGPALALGTATAGLAVLVLAFYIDSSAVRALYATPQLLWLLCPLFLYWTGRIWLLANRALVHDDPILFTLGDRMSYLIAVAGALIILLARG